MFDIKYFPDNRSILAFCSPNCSMSQNLDLYQNLYSIFASNVSQLTTKNPFCFKKFDVSSNISLQNQQKGLMLLQGLKLLRLIKFLCTYSLRCEPSSETSSDFRHSMYTQCS